MCGFGGLGVLGAAGLGAWVFAWCVGDEDEGCLWGTWLEDLVLRLAWECFSYSLFCSYGCLVFFFCVEAVGW